MARAIQIATLVLVLTVTLAVGIGVWGCFGMASHLIAAADRVSDATRQFSGMNGTIAETDKLLLALKSTTVHADMVIAHEDKQLAKYDGYARNLDAEISRLAGHSDTTLNGVDRVLAATTGTANAATQAIGTAQSTIASAQPLLGQLTATAKDADIVISNPQIGLTLADIQKSMASTASVTADTAKVTHHFEQIIDTPKKRTFWGTVKQGWQVIWQLGMLAK
jgi:hypothetical protein